MRTLRIELGARGYPIHIGHALLADAGRYAGTADRELRLITDRNVAALYSKPLRQALALDARHCLALEPGETQKTLASAGEVVDWLMEMRTPRDAMLIALGGGVVGDLVGFVAGIYQRGVDFIQVPTTLLAQVDSSVGGKTGVNHALGKNMVGVFHQPRAVIVDIDTLRTLPDRELRAGLAEVIKYGMLGDPDFFHWLEQNLSSLLALDSSATADAIEKCCAMKARIVAADEREAGPRALLNLGHTFAHAIETHTNYGEWLHGEAVAVGLCMAADLSSRLGWLEPSLARRCESLVARAGLPTRPPGGLTRPRFLDLMGLDKKVQAGKLRLVLMKGLGQAVVTGDFDPTRLQETLDEFCARAAA